MSHPIEHATSGAWLVGAGFWALGAAIEAVHVPTGDVAFVSFQVVWLAAHFALLVGLVGLSRLFPAGALHAARIGFGIAVVGRIVFVAAELDTIRTMTNDSVLLPIGALLTVIGMVTAGISIVRSQRWTSWRRFTPLGVGVFPIVFMFPIVAITGEPNSVIIGAWALAYAVLGIAIGQEQSMSTDATIARSEAVAQTR